MLALGFAGLLYLLFCIKGIKKALIITFFALVIPVIVFKGIRRSEDDLEGSSSSRFNYAITGLKMVKSNPIFGVGFGNYPRFYENFSSLFEEWGQRTAHSSWVLVMSESGFMGLFLFTGLVGSVFIGAWRLRHVAPEFFLSLSGYAIAMSFLSHTYYVFPYILFSLILVGTRVIKTATRENEESSTISA